MQKKALGIIGVAILFSTPVFAAGDHKTPTAPEEYLAMKNPFKADKAVLEEGKAMYEKKCGKKCHGNTGDAKGTATADMEIKPKPFTDKEYMSKRSDGQLFWMIDKGSNNTDMDPFGPESDNKLTKDVMWKLVTYIRQFAK